MSFERDVNVAVQTMFKHTKSVIGKNIRTAVKEGKITLDNGNIPGLELLINRSIDEAYIQAGRQLNSVLESKSK